MAYKLLILSFSLTLSAAYLLIDGHEYVVFALVYTAHLLFSTQVKDDPVETDPFDLLRYRPALMR